MTAMVEQRTPDLLAELTAKQREVLDLLIQHKTSKEISRQLGISPHTVDQRIMLARAKFNVANRNEVAQLYRQLISVYEQPVYQSSDVAIGGFPGHTGVRDDAKGGVSTPESPAGEPYHHVLPEMFDGPSGTLLRLGAMTAITVLMILVGLGGLSMFAQLSVMFDH